MNSMPDGQKALMAEHVSAPTDIVDQLQVPIQTLQVGDEER
jgi:hypothetical protein